MDKENDACANTTVETLLQNKTTEPGCHIFQVDAPSHADSNHQQKRYYFYSGNGRLDGKYLTHREAECVYVMLHGYTNAETAHKLNISPRTVEYYLKNIRNKLSCYSKVHLLRVISKTNFLETFEPRVAEAVG